MTGLNRYQPVLLALAIVLSQAAAGAQTPARSFAELQGLLGSDEAVVVTDSLGKETKGRVAELSSSSLTILSPAKRVFTIGEVARVRRKDSIWNGTQYGFWLGLGAWIVSLNLAAKSSDEFPYGWAYFGAPVSAGVGALAGMLIDRARGNDAVYVAPSKATGLPVTVSPWLVKKGGGVSLSMQF